MRGFHDEMGGPDSIASEAEWGPLSFGDEGMTAAGLPAGPGVLPTRAEMISEAGAAYERQVFAPSALPSERLTWEETQHSEMLRHNFLLRRHLTDPGYGVHDTDDWRRMAANGLQVPYVYTAPSVRATRAARANYPSPSESRDLPSTFRGQRRT